MLLNPAINEQLFVKHMIFFFKIDWEFSNDKKSNSTEDNFVNEVYNITLNKVTMMINDWYYNVKHILKSFKYIFSWKF